MPRIYLFSILLAVLQALIFGDTQFLFETITVTLWNKEMHLNSQIIISGLAVLILLILLLLGFTEKIVLLFKGNKKTEKKKEMSVEK